jgi:hypothetical protein
LEVTEDAVATRVIRSQQIKLEKVTFGGKATKLQ